MGRSGLSNGYYIVSPGHVVNQTNNEHNKHILMMSKQEREGRRRKSEQCLSQLKEELRETFHSSFKSEASLWQEAGRSFLNHSSLKHTATVFGINTVGSSSLTLAHRHV